ncbi:MAG: oxalyl-CoA decarboxylase [Bacteroidales bacterium]|nr:oxalyl-CoA decarboxylase [Bacteroidales bacterium]
MATPNNTNPNPAAAPSPKTDLTGMHLLANALKENGVEVVFGLVGIPVTEVAYCLQLVGIRFIGFRFEQQAGMAAATYGYLTKKPGILLTVSSMGFLNGLTATTNATVNCYPMIQISGSSDRAAVDLEQGTYEGLDQLNIAKPLVKAAYRVNRTEDIPTGVARALRAALSGRPGGVYLDMTVPALGGIMSKEEAAKITYKVVDPAPKQYPSQQAVDRAMELLATAKKPVIVLGKGAAYSQNDDLIKEWVEKTQIPYYPMSMAKGLLPDNHPLSALSARSMIMEQADVVILLGARLNWLLSRGHGKWNPDNKYIQLDIDPEEIDCNRPIAAPVIGDIGASLEMMLAALPKYPLADHSAWVKEIQEKSKEANAWMQSKLAPSPEPMDHWDALRAAKKVLESHPDVLLVNEGANTLDDCRDAIDFFQPRKRIDCATWAIMGMGAGSAIGAAIATGKPVVTIQGDSAFGFSGMDVATMCRFKLPITVCVFNNGGIYNNIGVNPSHNGDPAPTTLDLNAHYEKIMEAFGGKGTYVTTPEEYEAALEAGIASGEPNLICVQLAGNAGKESGHIGYLNPQTLIDFTV